jgi:hypothetical protein
MSEAKVPLLVPSDERSSDEIRSGLGMKRGPEPALVGDVIIDGV